jgi:hypothetical protein
MHACPDSQGKQIHTDDTVILTESTPKGLNHIDGEGHPLDYYISTILPDGNVVIIPSDKGIPEIIHGTKCTVTKSLLSDLEDLVNDEQLQRILSDVENKFNAILAEKVSKKPRKAQETLDI